MAQFTWRGEPILDIHAWARAREEQMVRYRAHRTVTSPTFTEMVEESYEGEMPASFYDNLLWNDGWAYTELSRDNP